LGYNDEENRQKFLLLWSLHCGGVGTGHRGGGMAVRVSRRRARETFYTLQSPGLTRLADTTAVSFGKMAAVFSSELVYR
jgi:hypothetical protein